MTVRRSGGATGCRAGDDFPWRGRRSRTGSEYRVPAPCSATTTWQLVFHKNAPDARVICRSCSGRIGNSPRIGVVTTTAHCERVRRFWARLSKLQRRGRGRRSTAPELRRLIEQMAAANPLWCAPRIHGELNMLGIAMSERTVSRLLRRLRRPPNQTWRTFLHNHVAQIVSTDFFTVPTFTMKVLFVFIVLEHGRRKVLHFGRRSLDEDRRRRRR